MGNEKAEAIFPRIGRVAYLNCLPVFYALEQGWISIPGHVVAGHPAELNRALAEGELEITAVSSLAYAYHFEQCLILPDLSISSLGQVKSVALLSKLPVKELEGKYISLTPYSSTSVALLSILLKSFYGVKAHFFTRPAGVSLWWAKPGCKEPAAALAIGDEALLWVNKSQGLFVYDLGEEWHRFTGQPMVFALWVVKRSFAREYPEKVEVIWRGLVDSKKWGKEHLKELALQASRLSGLPFSLLLEYFHVLQHDLTPKYLEGLRTFYQYAYREGWLPTFPQIEIWQP
ncbi:futalosine synthase [Thermanaeromonas toyohensis ToBE]|uniref:Chorismate dehydratase n=1 Tax=Thermanaeromonas toyohensis ToBE TaxID=698762 RepID=A0A1W1VXZ2_9FIRM|nr:menaquinone biosynthesis protein [Thermanaeromonas toyohensis]SMB98259.1 futalosine synthase [Thermanaeromonas toyohensis ToBE]